jgi:uncharacterized membrane protein YesL
MEKQLNILYQILSVFTSFFLLNLLWFLFCLPLITIFPATTALFGTVRKWLTVGFDVGVYRVFIGQFKENFKKSFIIGLFWTVILLILYFDGYIVLQNEFIGKSLLMILLIFFALTFLFTSIYVFFVLVHFDLTIKDTLKNSILLSISQLNYTVLFIGCILLTLILLYYFPFFLIVSGSLLAFCMYGLFNKLTLKIERDRNRWSST